MRRARGRDHGCLRRARRLDHCASRTHRERAILQHHPQYAHDLLSSIEELRAALDISYCHHERWNAL
ncbi:MAG: hypothetical protein EXS17_08210 [Phycisphaerales bacterium]|nr:hypothetical protein [Phycisphaerales bacterium]